LEVLTKEFLLQSSADYRVRNWPNWGPNYSVGGFFYELHCTGNRWHVYSELSFEV